MLAGSLGAGTAAVLSAGEARSAASQDWPPFVLVAGLLLVGLIAEEDGLFRAAGQWLARVAPNGIVLYCGAAALIVTVTAVLNLDTSVAFLTPVLVYTARRRGDGQVALLYGCLLLSNAGSLPLPGSNLTNLIVLGHLHLSGAAFLRHMAPAWLAAVVVTAVIVGVTERSALRTTVKVVERPERAVLGVGLLAVLAVTAIVLVLRSPALPVAAVGLAAVALRSRARISQGKRVLDVLGLPLLLGLFGIAVALGTLGRTWSGPAVLLSHLNLWGTAAVAAGTSVVVNNLPAASLLASRTPPHPYALLVGLNIGPNLFVTGSLAWLLWLRAAKSAGAEPSVTKATKLGALTVPFAMVAALGVLSLVG
jgi:arsenical pump membrane protein